MKNNLLKYLFILGSLTFTVNISQSTTHAASVTDFTDLSNSYAKDAINELAEAGILNGGGNDKFNPSGEISRQDFAIILAKALNSDTSEAPANPTFSDVPAGHYSYAYVEAVVDAGLLNGIGGGKFGVNSNLTMEQMATSHEQVASKFLKALNSR